MPNPKKRTSKSKRNMRRAHDFLTPQNLVRCSNCQNMTIRHRVCATCGYYKGQSIVEMEY